MLNLLIGVLKVTNCFCMTFKIKAYFVLINMHCNFFKVVGNNSTLARFIHLDVLQPIRKKKKTTTKIIFTTIFGSRL